MTTKKAYEAKNTHEAYNEATGTARKGNKPNKAFADLITAAWDRLDEVDYMVNWDEFDFDHNISCLREVDNELADELEAMAAEVYGTDEVEARDWNDWGEDW